MTGTGKWDAEPKPMCDEVQPILLEYMTRELGDARSVFVREHVRKCEKCQAAVHELEATLALLQSAKSSRGIPERLSAERRERIAWVFMHPVRDWIFRHSALFAVLITVLVITIVFLLLRGLDFKGEEVGKTYQVSYGRMWEDDPTNKVSGVTNTVPRRVKRSTRTNPI